MNFAYTIDERVNEALLEILIQGTKKGQVKLCRVAET